MVKIALILILAFSAIGVNGVKPLSDYVDGDLTFFGGAPDGKDPSSPSYGTL